MADALVGSMHLPTGNAYLERHLCTSLSKAFSLHENELDSVVAAHKKTFTDALELIGWDEIASRSKTSQKSKKESSAFLNETLVDAKYHFRTTFIEILGN